jgi:hypothetical protein
VKDDACTEFESILREYSDRRRASTVWDNDLWDSDDRVLGRVAARLGLALVGEIKFLRSENADLKTELAWRSQTMEE